MQDYTGSEILFIVLVGAVVFGVIAGLITAAVMRVLGGRKPATPAEPTLEEGVAKLRDLVAKAKALEAKAKALEAEAKAAREAADAAAEAGFVAENKLVAMEAFLKQK